MNISVIIPTFNRKKILKNALSSVFQQTVSPHEIIVVDDGSSDGTQQLVAEYPEVTYIGQENKGVSAARNQGIKHARGEWICFLDDDDIWQPKKLEEQVKLHQAYPDLSISQTEETWIRNGEYLKQLNKHKKYGGDIFVRCLPSCIITPSSVMIKKVVFDEVGLFDEMMPVCEDYDMWLRISVRYDVGLVESELIVKYGGHGDQLSYTFHGMDRYRIMALEKMVASPFLDKDKRRELLKEIARKCIIYAKGCAKHNKQQEADVFNNKVKQYEKEMERRG